MILRLPLLLLMSAFSSPTEASVEPRIVNGQRAEPTEYPFFAVSGEGSFFLARETRCGASLIHPDILLSAAHCQGAFNYEIFMLNRREKNFERTLEIDHQIPYPLFYQDRSSTNYDVLVMRLTEPIYDLSPIPINWDESMPRDGRPLTSVGFGITEYEGMAPYNLQEAQLQALGHSECVQRIQGIPTNVDMTRGDILCVDPIDRTSVCHGDSGGPLILQDSGNNEVLVGVASFGFQCQADHRPDGFARVSTFAPWIQQQICDLSRVPPENCPPSTNQEQELHKDAVHLRLVFHYDWDAHEITFAIRNQDSECIEYAGPHDVPSQASTFTVLIPLPPGVYQLEVYDKMGNGLQCPDPTGLTCDIFPDGSWELFAKYTEEEVLIASGDAYFAKEQITEFVVEGPPTTANTTAANTTTDNITTNNATTAPSTLSLATCSADIGHDVKPTPIGTPSCVWRPATVLLCCLLDLVVLVVLVLH